MKVLEVGVEAIVLTPFATFNIAFVTTVFVEDLFEQYYQSGSGQLAIKEHDAIAKAILDQNPKAAKSAMHAHIESSLKRFAPKAAAAQK